MNRLQRRMAVAGLVFGIAAGSAGPAMAAEKAYDEFYSYEYTMSGVDNPCTPEFDNITVTVGTRAHVQVWTEDGEFSRAQSSWRTQLEGRAADGTRYVGGSSDSSHANVEGDVVTVGADSKSRLTSQGSAPNFHLRYTTVASFELFGPGWSVEVIRNSTECRG
ncbi:MAG TPA: hypothetical protein VF045_10055 [Acidimicrobiales bacterium]